MTAGPTPLPPEVSQVMAEPILYHRAPAFIEIYERVLGRLRMVFQTEREVLMFAASGTGAMESAVANLVAPGDAVAGRLLRQVRPALGRALRGLRRRASRISRPNGASGSTPTEVERALADAGGSVRAVFTTHSETSTGVVNDVRALAEVAHRHGAVIGVDAVSGLGVVDLPTDAWEPRRGRVRVPEGADDAAGPCLLPRVRACPRAGARGARARRPQLLLRLGAHAQGTAQAAARQRPSRRRSRSSARWTSRSR